MFLFNCFRIMTRGTKKIDTSDYENLTKEVEQLSLNNDELLGKSLETELFFCKTVRDSILKINFDRQITLEYRFDQVNIAFYFKSREKLNEVEARKILDVVDEAFKEIKSKLKSFGWCANYHVFVERLLFRVDNHAGYLTTITFINKFVFRWFVKISEKDKPCNCSTYQLF